MLGVRLVAAGDGQRGAGRQCAGLEAAVDLGLDGVQFVQGLGAHDVAGFGVGRDDVGRAAAVGDDAVDAVGRVDVLAQQADGRLGDGQRVRGVDAAFGKGRGVGFLARVGHVEHGAGDDGRVDHVHRGGMDHHGRMHVRERAPLQQQNLAARVADFFRGGAEYADGQTHVVGHCGRGERGADRGRGNDVVAAGVADTGQAVVLGADRDVQRAAAGTRHERRGQVVHAGLHAEARLVERLRQPSRGFFFFEAQFGMGVDAVAEGDQSVLRFGEAFAGRGFGVHGNLRGSGEWSGASG